MNLQPTEKKFEEHIEKALNQAGYVSKSSKSYDTKLCLMKEDLLGFIQDTQKDKWGNLLEIHGDKAEEKVLARISDEIAKRGVVDVLRGSVIDRGVELELYYTKPRSGMNLETEQLYKQNRFSLVRQFYFSQDNNKSIDIALFLNGLPVVTMELKNQLSGQHITDGENQYKGRKYIKEPIFAFKRCLVHFCVDNDKVSMATKISGESTYFLPFNRELNNPMIESDYKTSYLWNEVLAPDSLLDIIENFAHLSKNNEYYFDTKKSKTNQRSKELLVFPRYHQLDLIRKLRQQLKDDGVGKSYLVQHTTGSGKSYSIGWLAHMLASFYRADNDEKPLYNSVIVVTDRRVLDYQLRNTINSLATTEGVVNAADKGSDLSKALEQGKRIIITTIQKFPPASKEISSLKDKRFAVIIDEVHSSQSGELSKDMKKVLGKGNNEDADYEDYIRAEIEARGKPKHISYFGFTGTPKLTTLEMFGTKNKEGQFKPFHSYSMDQSINEGFTLNVLKSYTTYKRYFKLFEVPKGSDKLITPTPASNLIMRTVDASPENIQAKVAVILNHWIENGSKQIRGQSRAMIVTSHRDQCVRYFKEVNRQLKERGQTYNCLVAFSDDVTVDGQKHNERSLNSDIGFTGKDIPAAFKDPKHRLIVIANKFQTGFDEPLLQSMYIDKKMQDVQCVQTLSRLNRTADGKEQTFVLDFANDIEDVREAFQRFYETTILSEETDHNKLYDLQRELADLAIYTLEDINRFYEEYVKGLRNNNTRNEGMLNWLLDPIVDNYKAKDEYSQEEFKGKAKLYTELYSYMMQLLPSKQQNSQLAKLFIFLRNLLNKLPKDATNYQDISDLINLDSLLLTKTDNKHEELNPEDQIMDPLSFDYQKSLQTNEEWLSELIKKINVTFGADLNENDSGRVATILNALQEDQKIIGTMREDNTEQNIKKVFKKRFAEQMITDINKPEQRHFYQTLKDKPEIRDMIIDALFIRCLYLLQ